MDFASIPKPGKSLKVAPAKVLLRLRALVADRGKGHESYFGLMFTVTDTGQGATRKDPAHLITWDGFPLLVMGLTGKKTFAFKVAYIEAFNAMAAYIKNQRDGLRYRSDHKCASENNTLLS